jgi:GntR family transcriptional regulator, transcriptional repressor for pyruvate dehydrogenase complex
LATLLVVRPSSFCIETEEPNVVEPVRRSRVSQQVVAEICRLIRQHVYRAGDRLPPERELAEQLQVSRPTLREALRVLEMSGIVESRHGGGTFIQDMFSVGFVSPLALVLEATGDIVGDLWEARIIFEPAIAARAALRATPDAIAQLEKLVASLDESIHNADPDEITVQNDRDFHIALARASGNQVAVRVLMLINELLMDGRRHFITSHERRMKAYDAHVLILQAIRERNPVDARATMLRHLEEIEGFILGEVIIDGPVTIESTPTGNS